MANANSKKQTKTKTQERKEQDYMEAVKNLLPWSGATLPNMANYTPSRLVDEVGVMKELEKDLKKVIGVMNTIIDSKLAPGEKEARGENYTMKISTVEQMRLDTDLARKMLLELGGQEALDACTKPLIMDQHRYSEN